MRKFRYRVTPDAPNLMSPEFDFRATDVENRQLPKDAGIFFIQKVPSRRMAPLRCGCAPARNIRLSLFPHALTRGFSLVEVVLALAVIAFALVGIMGLFPVAMKSAQESQRETRATLIAQQIFADLRISAGTNRFVHSGATGVSTSALSLAANGNLYLAFDASGVPLASISHAAFTNSYLVSDALFLASILVETNTGISNLTRIQATVETPSSAPSSARARYTFVTLMNY